jgi:hypothetical protein
MTGSPPPPLTGSEPGAARVVWRRLRGHDDIAGFPSGRQYTGGPGTEALVHDGLEA